MIVIFLDQISVTYYLKSLCSKDYLLILFCNLVMFPENKLIYCIYNMYSIIRGGKKTSVILCQFFVSDPIGGCSESLVYNQFLFLIK